MGYSYPEIIGFRGRYKQRNSFDVPPGALEDALNWTLQRDGSLSKIRGNYLFFDAVDTYNQLAVYQSTLIAAISDKLAYLTETGTAPNKTGVQNNLTGKAVAITGTRIARTAEANKNLYVTTDNGVRKLEAFNSSVFDAGVPPGLDVRATFLAENGPILGETQVGWRVLFGRRDANANLLLSAPSDMIVLTNSKVVGALYTNPSANLIEVTTTTAHNLSVGMTIIVTNATAPGTNVNGTKVITAINSAFVFRYDAGGVPNPTSGSLDYTATRKARLEISVPSEIDSSAQGFFYQTYRTTQTGSSSVTPAVDFKQIAENVLTAAEVTGLLAFFNDDVDDILLGAELYTNPNSQEGELQRNDRPPKCDDIAFFKNHMFYAACTQRHLLDLDVVDTASIANNDFIETKVDATTRRYVARTGVGNSTVRAESSTGAGTITITYAAHGLANGDVIRVSRVTGTLVEGTYTISAVAANTFDITPGGGVTATDLDFQGVTNGTYNIFRLDITSTSVSVKLRNTAQGIVKAINRDSGSLIYARYASSLTDIPGKMRFEAKAFTGAISVRASTTTVGGGFFPTLPDSFGSGTQVTSTGDSLPATVISAKLAEREAAPRINEIPVGASNKSILRIAPLRDSTIVIKQDGVYRLTGDNVDTFSVTLLDSTVICVAPDSVQILNNEVIMLSNQGVCRITDSSVQIISRQIDDEIQPILGNSNLSAQTSGIAYESDRLYHLSTLGLNVSTANVVHVYNVLNNEWTTTDRTFKRGTIGPSDTMYWINAVGDVRRERKNQTKIDQCDQNYPVTVISVAADMLSLVVSVPAAVVPLSGWVLEKDARFSRISTVTMTGVNQFQFTLTSETTLVAADTPTLYASFLSRLRLAPFHAGLIGRNKQFAQMTVHMRDASASELDISFAGTFFGPGLVTNWTQETFAESPEGWGSGSWGSFPWGDVDSINLQTGTQPSRPCRVYVTREHQRGTFLQPIIEHDQAGEPVNVQALSFAVNAYGERVAA